MVTQLAKARALARKVPGFFFSSYSSTAGLSSVLVREEVFRAFYTAANARFGVNTCVRVFVPAFRR